MRTFANRLTTVHAPYPDLFEQQQAQRLLLINLTWAAVLLLSAPLLVWWQVTDPGLDAATVFMPISLVLTLLTYRLIQSGQFYRARLLFVINILAAALLSIFPNYSIDTAFIAVMTLPLTAAGVLLRRSGLLAVALIIIAVISVGGLIQITTGLETTPIGDTPAESIRTTIFVIASIIALNAVMLLTFVSGLEDTLRQQRRTAHLLEIMSQISQTLVTLPAPGEELNHAVEQLRDALSLYHVQVFLVDPASGQAMLRASTGFIGRRMLEEESLLTPDESSPVNDVLRRADPILILDSAPAIKRTGFLPATRSELLVPLRVGALLPIGVLDLHSTASGTFSKTLLDTLITIGNQLAVSLYSAQQGRELRASYQERDQLSEQISTVQRELARLNRQLVGSTWGSYLEERHDAAPGFDWQEGAITASRSEPLLLDGTLADGQPRLEHRAEGDVLCVPIRLRGQTLGALEFRRTGQSRWSSTALELAQAVAERLALSLENARLFEQAQITAHREQLVSSVTTELQSSNDLQALLTLAASQFQEALGASYTQVRLGFVPPSSSSQGA